jgi:hypothetical protein
MATCSRPGRTRRRTSDVRRHAQRSAPVHPWHLRQPDAGLRLGGGVRWRGRAADQVRSRALATLALIARRLKAATTQKFPRANLSDGGTRFGPGQPVVTPSLYKAEIIAQYRQMEFDGLA